MDPSAKYRTVDCLTMIETRLPALRGASRKVAEAIVKDPWAILGMTIYDVAEAADVSLPSVTRFSRAVGYPGFRELVQGIAQSLGRTETKDLEAVDWTQESEHGLPAGVIGEVVRRQMDALQTTARALDEKTIEKATKAIVQAKHVTTTGNGGAVVPAMGMAVKLNWAGIMAHSATPDMLTNQLIAVDENDVIIAVSHQGRTKDVIDMLSLAKGFGATTIGITAVPNSPLSAVADIGLSVLTPAIARAGTFFIAFDTLMVLADVLAASAAEMKWGGMPPNRPKMVEWIETNLRTGPLPM